MRKETKGDLVRVSPDAYTADAGTYSFIAYLFDEIENNYEPILLVQRSDYGHKIENNSSEARKMLEWLLTLEPYANTP
ncbi:MAG: hypothetical protein L0332_16000 [Chloroflexi bacterium]|nr:hypothetical protein [Chloroflexota bacterium]MCI0580603.1 hypothetical protein [Chloroflexota bacterium]MCI0648875.1 hypothetical protein [Chloroflexota bacterium]MCI0728205.1 hypothetical protein [Chloroflexota bacterium]